MNNHPWVVKTTDGMQWRFENLEKAYEFYDILMKWGEQPSIPQFLPKVS